MANFWDFLTGTDPSHERINTRSDQQIGAQNQMLSGAQGGQSNIQGMDWLQSLFSNDPSAFAAYEAPAMRQFNEQIVPGIAERFTGMGAGGRNSSAFGQQLAGAGSRLSENLSAQRQNLRSGAMNQIMQMLQMSMQPTFENVMYQGQPGLLQNLAQGAGEAGMNYMTGGTYGLAKGAGNLAKNQMYGGGP